MNIINNHYNLKFKLNKISSYEVWEKIEKLLLDCGVDFHIYIWHNEKEQYWRCEYKKNLLWKNIIAHKVIDLWSGYVLNHWMIIPKDLSLINNLDISELQLWDKKIFLNYNDWINDLYIEVKFSIRQKEEIKLIQKEFENIKDLEYVFITIYHDHDSININSQWSFIKSVWKYIMNNSYISTDIHKISEDIKQLKLFNKKEMKDIIKFNDINVIKTHEC